MKAFFILSLVLFSITGFARKPAVEEFVGVEPEGYVQTTASTDVQFNFGNTINAQNTNASPASTNWFSLIALGAFVTLPFFMWVGMTRMIKKDEEEVETLGTTQFNTADADIAKLSDYRRKEEEKVKKAS